jgi:carbamoyltransferase
MKDGPVVLGVNRTQDASACLMRGSEVRWAIQKERLSRIKHHWGRVGDLRDYYASRLPGLDEPIDVLVECYSSDAEVDNLPAYERELAATLAPSPDALRARISHHVAHLYSAFHPSPFERAAVMVIDGQGSAVADFTETWPGAGNVPGDWREVSSFYLADRERIECLGKQLWDRNEQNICGLGMFYFLLTQTMFPGEGNEGKVMGLAPHGDPHALEMPPLRVEGGSVHMPEAWRALLAERKRFRYAGAGHTNFGEIANLAAAGQFAFEEAVLSVARWLHAQTGVDQLCFAGGTALNCSVNERILRETPFRQIFIPPAPGDAGTALGCAIYGLTELAGRRCDFRWRDDYLGPMPQLAEIEAAVAALRDAPELAVERVDQLEPLCERMADLLCDGQVVGLYQGRSEFGPRALGHRSILGDPRDGSMRDWINSRVKQREWFRPLAPVVLQERAADYFELTHPAPFMQFAVPVTAYGTERIRATTHVDRSARLQTVGPGGDPLLRALLLAFAARTGVPVLLNTSFNRRDEPIVETPAEALASFRATPMHALAMPPFLLRKRGTP